MRCPGITSGIKQGESTWVLVNPMLTLEDVAGDDRLSGSSWALFDVGEMLSCVITSSLNDWKELMAQLTGTLWTPSGGHLPP